MLFNNYNIVSPTIKSYINSLTNKSLELRLKKDDTYDNVNITYNLNPMYKFKKWIVGTLVVIMLVGVGFIIGYNTKSCKQISYAQ